MLNVKRKKWLAISSSVKKLFYKYVISIILRCNQDMFQVYLYTENDPFSSYTVVNIFYAMVFYRTQELCVSIYVIKVVNQTVSLMF